VKKKYLSKDIICPYCNEKALLDIKNFKINLYGCKNNHNINNLLLNKYQESQKINSNKIICNICNNTNKSETINNEFYICNTCNKNICPLCRLDHDINHVLINYDDKNYICKKHNEPFTKYCKKCNKDLCIICENDHKKHDIFDLSKILIDKIDLFKIMGELKNAIDNFKYQINIIKEIFDKMANIMDIYYEINNDIINNYNINKRNYYKLKNL